MQGGCKSQLEIMKTNIKTMICLCHNRLNTYPSPPHSFSKLHPNFWRSKSQHYLSTTSIKEQAVIQDIGGLNHTGFISYRRADRKPTNKPQCSQNPQPCWAPHTQPAQPAKAAPQQIRHARIHCCTKLAEEVVTERGYLYRPQPKYPIRNVKKSIEWVEITEGAVWIWVFTSFPSQWHCLDLCCQKSLFLCTELTGERR